MIMESREGRRPGDRKRMGRLRVDGEGGGVRIERALLWGGTLAIASLMALLTIRAKKRVSSRCPCGPEKLKVEPTEEGEGEGEGDENGGLRVVLQDQSSPTSPLTPRNSSCCIGGSYGGSSRTDFAHLDCCDLASGRSSMSEEKPAIEKDEKKEPHQETVFSDGAKTESLASFSSVVEDGSPPATQDRALATDDWNENTENHLEKQIIHASGEIDAFDHVAQIEVLMAEADESVDSLEDDDEEEEEEDLGGGDDEQAEEIEGSLEDSGDSCLELNNEAIWPLEMIDEVGKTIIEDRVDMTKINKQETDSIVHEEGEEENVGVDTSENPGDSTAFTKNGLEETVTGNCWKTRFPRPPIWIWRVLLLLVLLSLLVHGSSIGSFAMNRCDLTVK